MNELLKQLHIIVKNPYSLNQVGETGFEPATLRSQSECATGLRHSPSLSQKTIIVTCRSAKSAILKMLTGLTIIFSKELKDKGFKIWMQFSLDENLILSTLSSSRL